MRCHTCPMHERAGTVALPEDLIDVDALIGAYYDLVPDPKHRGSARGVRHVGASRLRARHGVQRGPHRRDHRGDRRVPPQPGHRRPALHGQGHPRAVRSRPERRRSRCSPRPMSRCASTRATATRPRPRCRSRSWSRTEPSTRTACAPPARGLADGIVITPSHNPPRDGGFKYNPPHGGPADTDATSWIAAARQRAARERLEGRAAASSTRRPSPPTPRRASTSWTCTFSTCPR